MLKERVKIGIDAREFVATTTGIARLLRGLFERLPLLRPKWHFIFYGNKETVLPFHSPNSRLVRIPQRCTPWWDQVTLANSLRKEKADLFFSPYYKVPFFSPCPVVHMIHDLIPLTNPSYRGMRYLVARLALSVLGKLYARRAAVTLTDSLYTKEILLERFHLPDRKVQVVTPGIETRFSPLKGHGSFERIALAYCLRKPYLLYVGNFKPHKRVDCMIRAFAGLSERIRQTTQLVLAGRRSPETKALERLVDTLRLRDQVLFTGFIAEEDLQALYGGATLFVFPSSDEGVGLPPLEAMACGVPVVSSRAASLPEILGPAAVFVEPGNIQHLTQEMERLLGDAGERQRRSQMGLEQAKRFSVETQCQLFLSVLDRVLVGC